MSSTVNGSLVGELVDGRYRVVAHIAEGGMASVYLATDTRLDRDVALKVMRPHLAEDEAFVSRFRREARSAARLSDPHVVQVSDQGEDGGRVFLAMEYVPGRTLREVLQAEGALTPRAALDILDPVLQALDAAHRAGYIHRDVKPENVILREDGVVKVADFGLARAVTSQTSTTHTGLVLGTVAYLSPEQVERGIADVRSDVYAAGLVLLEMLTGRKAFAGESPIHVAYQHVHGTVPVPSDVAVGIPPELDALVARATARDPDARPADGGAFLAELREVRAGLDAGALDARPGPVAARASSEEPTRTTVLPLAGPVRDRPVGGTEATGVLPVHGPDAGRPRSRRPLTRRRLAVLLPALLLLGAATTAWYLVLGPGARTTVPSLTGLTVAAAGERLSAAHLEASRRDEFSEDVARGRVIAARPGQGAELGRGSSVLLTVSRGPERYAVPDVTGRPRDAAVATLKQTKLAAGSVTRRYDENVPKGRVVSTDPGVGTRLRPGTSVDLVVSRGREPIEVPSVVGQTVDEATAALEDRGLTVETATPEYSTDVPDGSVAAQDPASGTLYRGDTVTLTPSKGPEMVTVPDVQSMQEEQARTTLERAGLAVEVRRILGGFFGTVRSQDPQGGTDAPKGSTVTITVV